MGRLSNFLLSVTPGQGPAAAAVQRQDQEAKRRRKAVKEQEARVKRARDHKRRLAREGSKGRLI